MTVETGGRMSGIAIGTSRFPTGTSRFPTEMSEVAAEAHRRDASDAARAALDKTPRPENWAFFSYDDGPVICGGGMGALLWFDDADVLWGFLGNHFAWCAPGAGPAEAADVRGIIDGFQAAEADPEETRAALNAALAGYVQVEWWGTLEELIGGDTAFGRRVRDSWRVNTRPSHAPGDEDGMDADDEERGDPVPTEDVQAFVAYLGWFGI